MGASAKTRKRDCAASGRVTTTNERGKKMETIVVEKIGKRDFDFEGIEWAMKAVSKDVTRPNINRVLVDHGCMVCTDGHRLHMYKIQRDIPDGMYLIEKKTKQKIILNPDDSCEFPAYERVFPNHNTMKNGIPDWSFSFDDDKENKRDIGTKVLRKTLVDYDINLLFDFCPRNQKLHFRQDDESYLSGRCGRLVMWNDDYTMCGILMSLYNR